MTTSPRYISNVETAKLVREELKRVFPLDKFSVTVHNSSVQVRWTNGLTEFDVKQAVGKFGSESFDASTDLYTSHNSTLNGEAVRFLTRYVMTSRNPSPTFECAVGAKVAEYFSQPLPSYDDNRNWFVRDDDTPNVLGNNSLMDLIRDATAYLRSDMTINRDDPHMPLWLIDMIENPRIPFTSALKLAERQIALDAAVADFQMDYEGGGISGLQLDRLIEQAEIEAETVDETPCVKVSAETLQPVIKPDALRAKLTAVNIDTLSPLEALTLLYELKRLA